MSFADYAEVHVPVPLAWNLLRSSASWCGSQRSCMGTSLARSTFTPQAAGVASAQSDRWFRYSSFLGTEVLSTGEYTIQS